VSVSDVLVPPASKAWNFPIVTHNINKADDVIIGESVEVVLV
jgi:hypothetical protein